MTDEERLEFLQSTGLQLGGGRTGTLTDIERQDFLNQALASESDLPPLEEPGEQRLEPQLGPLARNPAWQTLVSRPAAQYRGFIRGLAPGGETPLQGFERGALAKGQELVQRAEPFNFRTPVQTTLERLLPLPRTQAGILNQTAILTGAQAAAMIPETIANIATNPVETLATLIPFSQIGKGIAASEPGRAVGRWLKSEVRLPRLGRPRLETVDEVLRVPEARLPKLTKQERTAYFQARSNRIQEEFSAKRIALKNERMALGKELGKAERERSLYIREKLPEIYSRQSAHYRELVDQELAPVANDLITDTQIRSYLMRRFANDPERLNAVSNRLGLINETVEQAAGVPPPTFKIGELYQKALDFGQTLPRSVRESLRVYSAADDATDDAISSLVEILDEQGVHLREARSFWKSWKPIQTQATREFRPFLSPDVATGIGGARLSKIAKGIDPHNEVYAKNLAELLGIDDLPGGTIRGIVGKLDTNQKIQLAITLMQKEATKEIQALRFSVNQIADRSARKWHAAKIILGWLTGGSAAIGAISALRQQ